MIRDITLYQAECDECGCRNRLKFPRHAQAEPAALADGWHLDGGDLLCPTCAAVRLGDYEPCPSCGCDGVMILNTYKQMQCTACGWYEGGEAEHAADRLESQD